ncbi:hypothetical protein DHEL01_v208636 [Diaporthe helianthi]|uniref:Six-hairpin glycosidase-like protein n=1 Tax=Diaporthe helianthi TaxID=158607 RepID=A0A2P5HRS0_DIAHE|nr:hypothetical protein DHEL01_v208636 [Diaporthe helianthi]
MRSRLIDNTTTPLQVGNGNFAFNVDNTGMQSFLPFNTLSSWGWHNDSLPTNGEKISDYHGRPLETHGRNVSYDYPDTNLPLVSQWLIANPNRINLGRIGLKYKGNSLSASMITEPMQELDLWNGIITSSFQVDGTAVKVITQGDFESDSVAFQIQSPLLSSGDLEVELDFPYPPVHTTKYKYEVFVGSYDFPLNHSTSLDPSGESDSAHVYHEMQETSYFVNLRWPTDSVLTLLRNEAQNSSAITAHRYTLSQAASSNSSSSTISFTANFSPEKHIPDLPSAIQDRNPAAWNDYWEEGGFVDLTGSTNPSATELQRRIVLSQYHVRVNSAADGQSPQESGLMNNGWYGKFHMEVVVLHNAHWITWGRKKYFDNIFPAIYETLLPSSEARAKSMGWEGARWPKMTELGTGRSSPGAINALLLWQQPHPMYLAELAYIADPSDETLKRWDKVLTASADYMASYAWYNQSTGYYDLGPPSYGVTENTPPLETRNLAYELAYWQYGLNQASTWKQRLNATVPEHWTTVASQLAPIPIADDGLYTPYEGPNSSWWADPELSSDPRSLSMLRGILPSEGTPAVDEVVAKKTADRVHEVWGSVNEKVFGWGRPVLAINAARLGEPERAVGYLTAFDWWVFDDAGFAERGGNGGTPPPFLDGNAFFLHAVAYMAAGWQGSEGDAPGFPKDGSWSVVHEGLFKAP